MLHRITSQIDKFYNRYRFVIEDVIMPLTLLIWPLVMAAQGVDVSDSTYSPGNYMFPETVGEVWLLSTYLSYLIGVDGGISESTGPLCYANGADYRVAGSAYKKSLDKKRTLRKRKGAL